LGGMFRPAPAVLGVFVCSKTFTDENKPVWRNANADINPPIPAPTITALIWPSYPKNGDQVDYMTNPEETNTQTSPVALSA
jgi:hypothetical protein